ncbi:MAG: hypothetical protein WBW99_23815, partial [Pseudolabrys sp.]
DQVLDHFAVGCSGKTYDRSNIVRVAFDQNYVGGFDRHVRARTNGNADIGLRAWTGSRACEDIVSARLPLRRD